MRSTRTVRRSGSSSRALIARSGYNGAELYLTDEDNLVWIDEDETFGVSSLEGVDADGIWNFIRDDDATGEACRALGLKRVVRL